MPQKQRGRGATAPEGEPELLVPTSQMDQELEVQITQGQELLEWTTRVMGQPLTWPPSEDHWRVLPVSGR